MDNGNRIDGSVWKLSEILCVCRNDYLSNFMDGETPKETLQDELDEAANNA